MSILSNPTPEPVKAPLDDTLTTWDKFSIDDDLKVLDLDWEVKTQKNFRQQRNAFFYDYISSIVGRPLTSGTGRTGTNRTHAPEFT
jgi:glucose dehydrogenase